MAKMPSWIGGFNQERGQLSSDQRTINGYLEAAGPGSRGPRLIKRPGLRPHTPLGTGAMRSQLWEPSLQKHFAVSGNMLWETFAGGTATAISPGGIGDDGTMATMITGGRNNFQLLTCSAGNLFVYDYRTQAFTQVVTDFEPLMIVFDRGVALAAEKGTNKVRFSKLYDFGVWPPLNVFKTSLTTNTILSIVESHGEIGVFGAQTTEFWSNQAGPGTHVVYSPVAGGNVIVTSGTAASFGAANLDNTVFYLKADARGGAVPVRLDGYRPQIISIPSVATKLQALTRFDNAVAFTFQFDSHEFYGLDLPNSDSTFMYDASNDTWCEWAIYNTSTLRFEPWLGRTHAYAFNGVHLVGDRTGGMLYQMSPDFYDDARAA